MSERREVEHHEEHTEVTAPPAEPPAAEAVVDTAEAAVALAHATAAAAELDAAERTRAIEEEAVAWRNQTTESLASLSDSLRLLREGELSEMQINQLALADRLAAIEAHPSLQSTRQPSQEAQEAEGAPPIVGGEANANLGPAEASAGASLGASSSEEATSPGREGRKRNHRWI